MFIQKKVCTKDVGHPCLLNDTDNLKELVTFLKENEECYYTMDEIMSTLSNYAVSETNICQVKSSQVKFI